MTGKISFGQRGQPKTGLHSPLGILCQEHQRGDCKNLLSALTQIPLHNICLIMIFSQNGLIITEKKSTIMLFVDHLG